MTSASLSLISGRFKAAPDFWILVAICAWTLMVRLPFLHIIHDDEAFYAVIAQRWLQGELPYVASYDIKGPGIFAVLALLQSAFGMSLGVIKGAEILFTIWAAFGLYRIVEQHGSLRSACLIAGLYPFYSLFLMGVSSPCQLLEMAFVVEAFAQVMRAQTVTGRQHLIALMLGGFMMGCAVMTKQTEAFTALGLFGWLAWKMRLRRQILPLLLFCIMGVMPALAFGAYFALAGHFAQAYDAVVKSALHRSQVDMSKPDHYHLGILLRLLHFPAFFKPMLIVMAGALLALLRLPRLRSVFSNELIDLVFIWYITAVVGILVTRSPDIWYGFTLLAPALILFCGVLCHGIDFSTRWKIAGPVLYVFIAALQPFITSGQGIIGKGVFGPPDYLGNIRAAQALKSAGIQSGDNLLVAERGHYAYVFTGALPKAKYFNAMHILCTFPTPVSDPLAEAFATQPKFVLMSNRGVTMGCLLPSRAKALDNELTTHYTAVSEAKGSWDSFTVYRRKVP